MENMKLTLEFPVRVFTKAMSLFSAVVPSNPIVPACSMIHVKVNEDEGYATFKSTDLSVTVKTDIDFTGFEIFDDGGIETEFCFPYAMVNSLSKTFPAGPMRISYFHDINPDSRNKEIHVYGIELEMNGKKFSISSEDSKDYPKPKINTDKSFSIPSNIFKYGLGSVKHLVSSDQMVLDSFRGVALELTGDEIVLTATDRTIYGFFIADLKSDFKTIISIPTKAVKFIYDNLDNSEDEIKVDISDTSLVISRDDWAVAVKLNTELFQVSYQFMNKLTDDMVAVLDIEEWKSTLKRAMMMVTIGETFIKHVFREDKCFIVSEDGDKANQSEQYMEIDDVKHDVDVTLNGKHIEKLLSSVSGAVEFATITGQKQIFVRPKEIIGKRLVYSVSTISELVV